MADGWVLRISKYLRHPDVASITLRGPRIDKERMDEVLREVFPNRTVHWMDNCGSKMVEYYVRDEKVQGYFTDNETSDQPMTDFRMSFW